VIVAILVAATVFAVVVVIVVILPNDHGRDHGSCPSDGRARSGRADHPITGVEASTIVARTDPARAFIRRASPNSRRAKRNGRSPGTNNHRPMRIQLQGRADWTDCVDARRRGAPIRIPTEIWLNAAGVPTKIVPASSTDSHTRSEVEFHDCAFPADLNAAELPPSFLDLDTTADELE